jgi:peptidoglycan-associated lipoprotein
MKQINSTWDDFSPTYSNSALNEIIFTSNRGTATGKKKDEWTGSKFTDLFTARKNLNGKWNDPVLLESDGTLNTPVNEGSPAMSGHFTTLYFTRCEKPEDRAGGCAIYRSKRQGMVWTEPQRLDLVADSSAVIGHPTVTPDESMLIVSAELPGGKGKRDLWYSLGKGGNFKELQNLGSVINTPGNEMFPHLRGDSVLYFSSDYLPGMGGLDIFRSRITYDDAGDPVLSEPENLRYPINSVGDDFGICFHPEGNEEGYFSTRRKTGEGANIYHFLLEPVIFTISGFVRDQNSMMYVPGVTITLIGSDSSAITMKTGENGTYMFSKTQVKANTDYTVIIEKEGYISYEEQISTKGLEASKNFKIDFMNFQPVPREPVVLPEILFDYGKWDLKPIFQDSLRGLIMILEANPTITIELGAHTDSRGSAEANRELAQKRAQAVVDYLIDRGIEANRLTAKGYGEDVPRVLQKDFIRDGHTYPKGTELNDDYVYALKSRVHQEAAHQMNRRIEFIITSTRYQAKGESGQSRPVAIDIGDLRRGVPFEVVGKKDLPQMDCFINGLSEVVILDESGRNAVISLKTALGLLRDGYITKDDFEGNPEKVLAGGTIANNAKFIISDLKIGLRTEYDIRVTVDSNYTLPLTIPASVMKRFGDYTIDREKNMLFFEE